MKTKLMITAFGLAGLTMHAQFANPGPGGPLDQYLTNNDAFIRRTYLNGEHLIFDSQHGAIDWGAGGTGDLFFRTLNTQGVYTSYNDRMRIKNNGDVWIGTISSQNTRLHVMAPFYTSSPSSDANGGLFEIWASAAGNYSGVRGHINISSVGGTPASHNAGVWGKGVGSGANVTVTGVTGQATGDHYNYGGYFSVTSTFGHQLSAAVYGEANGSFGNTWAGWFDGDVNINGDEYINLVFHTSDQKLKRDIRPIAHGLDKIMLLNPSTYLFRTDEFKAMRLPEGQQLGLIAQELEKVFPELVSEVGSTVKKDLDGNNAGIIPEHKVVNYTGLIPVLISGMQEQQQQIEAQRKMIAELQRKTGISTGLPTGQGSEEFQMNQNEPNPFNGETTIRYTLPQSVNKAELVVYDLTGKQVNAFPIEEKGASSLVLTSEKLAAGIYIYSIVADGKIMDSKRMVVSEK